MILSNEKFRELCDGLVGRPYVWGGDPATGGYYGGLDCSGFVRLLLMMCGVRSFKMVDVNASGLWALAEPYSSLQDVPASGSEAGGLVIGVYGDTSTGAVSHVVAVYSDDRDASGIPVIVGANGGGYGTNGDDPDAAIKIEASYWTSGLIGFGLIRPDDSVTTLDYFKLGLSLGALWGYWTLDSLTAKVTDGDSLEKLVDGSTSWSDLLGWLEWWLGGDTSTGAEILDVVEESVDVYEAAVELYDDPSLDAAADVAGEVVEWVDEAADALWSLGSDAYDWAFGDDEASG